MVEVTVSRTQWEYLTTVPYTDGVFNCNQYVALALVKSGVAKYTDVQTDNYDSQPRSQLMKYAKSLGIKTSPKWKKAQVIEAIRKHET
jgi:hypothetical protein